MINKEKSDKIKELVREIVHKHSCKDPEQIVEDMEINVFDISPSSKKESVSIIFNGRTSIFIDFKLNAKRFYHRLAHELGHILLHCDDCNHEYSHRRWSHNHKILDYEADFFADSLINYQNAFA